MKEAIEYVTGGRFSRVDPTSQIEDQQLLDYLDNSIALICGCTIIRLAILIIERPECSYRISMNSVALACQYKCLYWYPDMQW